MRARVYGQHVCILSEEKEQANEVLFGTDLGPPLGYSPHAPGRSGGRWMGMGLPDLLSR